MGNDTTNTKDIRPEDMSGNRDKFSMDMTLADMLTGMIQSTVAADQKAAEDYLKVLRDYALMPSANAKGRESLKMIHFEMTDSDGERQVISIPKLSLLPLPVLRVSEATFDIDAQLDIKTVVSGKEREYFLKRYPLFKKRLRSVSKEERADKLGEEMLRRKIIAPGVRVRLIRPVPTETSKSMEMEKKMTNIKIHVKLEPVQLPDGMRGLLQATDSSIKVITKDKNQE